MLFLIRGVVWQVVRFIGVSNFSEAHLDSLLSDCRIPPQVRQPNILIQS